MPLLEEIQILIEKENLLVAELSSVRRELREKRLSAAPAQYPFRLRHRHAKPMTAAEFLELYVERVPFSGCWIWMRTVNPGGYGSLVVGKKTMLAHRLSYETFVGPINGMHVLHRCDTPPCINPQHLFLGTHYENMMDCVAKGRTKRGRRAYAA